MHQHKQTDTIAFSRNHYQYDMVQTYSKTCLKRPIKKKTDYLLMQVKSIAKCSILQYFQPSLSNHLSLRSLFCLFLSGRFRQVLLYTFHASLRWKQAGELGGIGI